MALNTQVVLPIGIHETERQPVFRFVLSYVDPGVGPTVLQLALAGTVGIGALVKLRWQSVEKALGREDEPVAVPEKAAEPTR